MAAHDPKEGAREKAGWGLPVPAPAGARATERVIDELFAAPTGAAVEADPVASLFQDSRALPAPAIDVQNEAEITRWRAAGKASLFDESVPDPVPSAGNTTQSVRARNPANALSVPPPVPPGARKPAPPQPAASLSSRASLPPVPVSQAPISLSMAPLERVSSAPAEGAETRKRRIERGPKKSLLVAIGVAATLTLGSAAAVLRLIPNPLSPASQAAAAIAAPAPAPAASVRAAPPMAVPVHGFKPAPVPAPAAATEAVAAEAAPAAPAAADTAATAAAAAPPAIAPVAAPVARSVAPKLEAPKAEAKAPVAAAPAPAAALAKVEAPQTAAPNDGTESNAGSEQNQRLVSAANKKLAEDDPKGAEALMREALSSDPDDHHAMEVLVRALIDQDRGAEAVPFARKMVRRRSKRVAYRLLLGDALLMTGDENGARREWKAALDVEPNDRQVRMRLGL